MKWQLSKHVGRLYGRQGRWDDAERKFERYVERTHGLNAESNYYLANAKFNLGAYGEALLLTERAVELDPTHGSWFYRLGALYERVSRHDSAAEAFGKAVVLAPHRLNWRLRLAESHEKANNSAGCLDVLRTALLLSPRNFELNRTYVEAIKKHGRTWQMIDALEHLIQEEPEDGDSHRELGFAKAELGLHDQAAHHLACAEELGKSSDSSIVELGHQLELCGRNIGATKAYETAIFRDNKLGASEFGPGVFFQKRGMWPEAAAHFQQSIFRNKANPELWYKLGISYDRSYKWEQAEEAILTAAALRPEVASWHYRLGLVRERQTKWLEASEAYAEAVRRAPDASPYWRYRLGYCLMEAGEVDAALLEFGQLFPSENVDLESISVLEEANSYSRSLLHRGNSIAVQSQLASACFQRSVVCLRAGAISLAAELLFEAVRRDERQRPEWYYRLGKVLVQLGRKQEALDSFLSTRGFRRPDGVSTDRYFRNESQRQSMEYVEFMESLTLEEDVVLYESNFGGRVDCNPLAIFESARKDSRLGHMRHVWVVKSDVALPPSVMGDARVIVVTRGSTLYRRYLATAKYLVNNVTFPHYFVRREGQRYLNTWHGTPIKTLGKDIQTGFMEHANVSRNLIQATHLLAPNEHTQNCLVDRYDIDGLFTGVIGRLGSPRIDRMINMDASGRDKLRGKLGIPRGKPIIFYAPTWRGSQKESRADSEELRTSLEALASQEAVVLFRAHHLTEELLGEPPRGVVVVPPEIDTYEALSVTDVLVTDYSSILFDFLPGRKPIVFYAYDLEEYKSERGLYFELDQMPGVTCTTPGSLATEVSRALTGGILDVDLHEEAVSRFAPDEYGLASTRCVNFFFHGDQEHVLKNTTNTRPTVVIHQSMLPNGITSSVLNLMARLNPDQVRAVFLFAPESLIEDDVRMEKFKQIPDHVQKIGRVGGHLVGLEERWLKDKFNQFHNFATAEQERIYRASFEREHRRIFGEADIRSYVEFDGYDPFWLSLVGADRKHVGRRIVYLHNHMYEEWSTKYGQLSATFRLYPWFDRLVSVSEITSDTNRLELAPRFGIDKSKFTHVQNVLQPDKITELAEGRLDSDVETFLSHSQDRWVSIGRLSPEKGFTKLIEAFSIYVSNDSPTAVLVILGDGPLKGGLHELIRRRGLENNVLLGGRRSNPFPIMRNSDAFILPSDHEGQPMVLLEALTLGLSTVATDIPGSRSVLGEGFGLLVDNSTAGVLDGLRRGRGHVPTAVFDVKKYVAAALHEFKEVVLI